MKKFFLAPAAALVLAFVVQGCGGGDEPGGGGSNSGSAQIEVSPAELTFNHEASSQTLTITSDKDWSVYSEDSWIDVSPRGGVKGERKEVKVSVISLKDVAAREGKVTVRAGQTYKVVKVSQSPAAVVIADKESVTVGASAGSIKITLTANTPWTASGSESWITVSPASGEAGDTQLTVSIAANPSSATRNGAVRVDYAAGGRLEIPVAQLSDEITVPEGYTLVWSDEFNEGTRLDSDWTHERQSAGWVNNELQNYVNGEADGKRVTEIENGILKITCFKSNGKIYSGRVYAKVNEGWLYGWFEARIKLPKGKGTWPAFWMMPVGNDWNTNPWPRCGEIDIMEEVGYHPDYTSSSIHCESFNHTIGTQKTHEQLTAGAEQDFHVYACEWTADFLKFYVDGKLHMTFTNDGQGHSHWPFYYPFYPILNLAWGGSWGGAQGVDESVLPATMEVDYVRVFQK